MTRLETARLYAKICVKLSNNQLKYGEKHAWHNLMSIATEVSGMMIQRRYHEDGSSSVVVYDSVGDWKNSKDPLVVKPEFKKGTL